MEDAEVAVYLLILGVLYFIPWILALGRKMPNQGSVLVINLFFGWTFIGWVVALAMAAGSRGAPVNHIHQTSIVTPHGGHPAPDHTWQYATQGPPAGAQILPAPPSVQHLTPPSTPPAPPAPPAAFR